MDKLIETFVELAKIPSPSLGEDKVRDRILEMLEEEGIQAQKDGYGNSVCTEVDTYCCCVPSC